MQSVLYSTAYDSFILDYIIHLGPVVELSPQQQKNEYTHSFRITTVRGPAYCYFKTEGIAVRSRGILCRMLDEAKPYLFRSRGDLIDISQIVSFGRVIKFKKEDSKDKFGIPIQLATSSEKVSTLWITFQSESEAKDVRKALYCSIMSHYRPFLSKEADLQRQCQKRSADGEEEKENYAEDADCVER